MRNRTFAAGVVALSLALAVTGVASAAHSAAVPKKATVDQTQSLSFKPNRFFKDTLRWRNDVYHVKSGGTLHLVDSVVTEGPHTFSVVKRKDLPKTVKAVENCKICAQLGQAHGVDPNNEEAPPKFQFLENGTGSDTAPGIDRPGDSVLIGPGKKGESVDVKVTAKKNTTLYFMCLIHAQMQAKVIVG